MDTPTASTSDLTFNTAPTLVAAAQARSKPGRPSTFYRDARICPDGSCVLVAADDRSLSLFRLPPRFPSEGEWTPEWTHAPSDALLSYEWFPGASSTNPAMFAFAVAVKDHPVHLLDAGDLRLRASYPIIDHRERFIAPHSMAFSADGTSLYCGFENAIEIIDVATPGSTGHRIHTSPTRSSRLGQKGIISSLTFSPNYSGLLAAGSFNGTIGFYDTNSPDHTLVSLLKSSEAGGITQIQFHPASHLLYSASRLSDFIEIWDMRNLSQVKGKLRRPGKTNQRLGFDLDSTGSFLACGDQEGNVTIYDAEYDEYSSEPVQRFRVSPDPVGCTRFLPSDSKLLTMSGTRHFDDAGDESDDSDTPAVPVPVSMDRSLKLWQLH